MSLVEIVTEGGAEIAYILRASASPDRTTFLTPGTFGMEMGLIVYGGGQNIQPHFHMPVTREIRGTTECILVRKGRCIVDFYRPDRSVATSRELQAEDIVLLLGGGHGFRMLEDTILFEVKQGPYLGEQEKERFDPAEMTEKT
jgi:hypothetical protein